MSKLIKRFGAIGKHLCLFSLLTPCDLPAQTSDFPAAGIPAPATKAQELVSQMVGDALLQDTNFLGRVRFQISDGQKVIQYDLAPDPPSQVISEKSPLALPTETLIQVACLRRDFKREGLEASFGAGPLDKASQEARSAVNDLVSETNSIFLKKRFSAHEAKIHEAFTALDKDIQDLATQRGLDVEKQRAVDDFYNVEVDIVPDRAKLEYMTYLAYRESALPPPLGVPLEQQWLTLSPGMNKMIGHYHSVAIWPKELGGLDTNDFLIRCDTTLTFRPPNK
jgi:hypothetical protein